jgi:hypothetical protein
MRTVKTMIGKQKLRSSTGKPQSRFASCVNHHAFIDRLGTGGNRFLSPLYFNKAEATGSKGFSLFPNGTEVGYIDTIVESSPEDRVPLVGC